MKSFFLSLATVLALLAFTGCTDSTKKESDSSIVRPDPNLQPGLTRTLVKSPEKPIFNLDRVESSSAPLFANGTVPVTLPRSTDLALRGWAIDKLHSAPAGGVDVAIDGVAWQAALDLARGDVAAFFKNPAYLPSGFQFHMRSGAIAIGSHSLTIRVVSNDRQSYFESLPLKLVIE